MFKMVTLSNGRSIYAGKVKKIDSSKKAIVLSGKEYDRESQSEVEKQLVIKTNVPDDVVKGDSCLVTFLPSEKDETKGTASAISFSHQGGAMFSGWVQPPNGKKSEQFVIMGTVKRRSWNDKKTLLHVSFLNLHNEEGKMMGNPSSWKNNYGNEITSYWMNVNSFPNREGGQFQNFYDATRFDKVVEDGDVVVCVARRQDNEYNGKTYTNYNMSRFFVIEKKDGSAPASSQSSQTSGSGQQSQPQNSQQPKPNQTAQPQQAQPDFMSGFDFDEDDELPFN